MRCTIFIGIVLLIGALPAALYSTEPVRFGREILPILSANCFSCHGPDERNRKAGLRLDREADAKARRRSGFPIVAGQPEKSLLFQRVASQDPDVVMPPAEAHRHVTPDQIEVIRRWIAEGATWGRHWSFEPVIRPVPPATGVQPIDAFVSATLQKKGLSLRPAASPQSLVRRLWLDLTGLPPTPEIADRFARDPSRAAYESMVDDLLRKPQFGEHWARMWLDLARYADTKGYEKDRGRTVWPYRDWVINAFNSDMHLDAFTIEQLAGDLLPNPSRDHLIATTFHRNTMANDEGGTDDEEFRVAAVKDRIDTTVQVWMGLTMGCAKCHTHKYDPIPNAEYYGFFALFNQTEDADRYDEAPTMEILTPAEQQERDRLKNSILSLTSYLNSLEDAADKAYESEEQEWTIGAVVSATSTGAATLKTQTDGSILASGKQPEEDTYVVTIALKPGLHRSLRLEALPEKLTTTELAVGRGGPKYDFTLSELTVEQIDGAQTKALKLSGARADYSSDKGPIGSALDGNEKTGWSIGPRTHERHMAIFDFVQPLNTPVETQLRISLSQQAGTAATLRHFRFATSPLEPAALKLRVDNPDLRRARDEAASAFSAQRDFNDRIVRLPIMRELGVEKQRTTKIQRRGSFLDQGDVVAPTILTAFNRLPVGAPLNRLGVAQWLVDRDNPLTPRVWANRIWARLFGIGIVETEEDFGALGAAPSNPDLLDWLAAEYRDGGWSLKKLIKTIVLSDTYRQASAAGPGLRETDPRNLLQSRGARYRLGAETLRDQALSVSALLSLKMGGPPVMPPQPAGLWRSTYSGKSWIDAEGEDRVRRGIYTYLKRTTPYPSMTTFDGGSGEVCQIRRIRTNTPLQALVTLNDPVFLEAAAGLAQRMIASSPLVSARAARGLRLALIRPLRKGEVIPLVRLQRDAQSEFQALPGKADELIKASRATLPAGISKAAFASWIVVANAILNLDEFLSRN